MIRNYKWYRFVQVALMGTVLVSGVSLAQEGEETLEIEEVIVTAEKRAQNIQDVPLSVAAIGGNDIRLGKIANLSDITYKTPGLTFARFNVGELRIYIRGIGNSSDSAASDPAVGIFVDDVYIGRTGGAGVDLMDLERIEILRGPQGTLYGKNTNGGAVHFVTRSPSQEREVKISGSVGNYGMTQLQGLINGGLSDSVSGKFVFSHYQRDGFGKNVITADEINTLGDFDNSVIIGGSIGADGNGEDLDDLEKTGLRGQLLFDISDSASLLLSADYSKAESNGTCRHLQNLDNAIQGLGPFWAMAMSEDYLSDERNCSTQFDTKQEREIKGVMARYDRTMDWANFSSITAWRDSESRLVDDLTSIPLNDLGAVSPPGMPFPLSLPGVFTAPENVIDAADEDASQFSQEFRLTGTINKLDWVAGAFYMKEDVTRDEEFYTHYSTLLQFLGLAPVGDVLFTQDNTTTSKALYAQGDWHMNDQWTLTYGLRWSDDKKEIEQNSIDLLGTGFPTGVPLILPEFPAPVFASESWSKVTQKLSVNYKPNDNLMLFATYSEGFKSGAFPSQTNLPAVAGSSVDPEFVTNHEVGFKSTLWDGRIQFNMVYYDMDYDDLQVFELNSQLLLVLNSAQAESKGVDVEFNILPLENLMISTSYNYSDAVYTDFINSAGNDYSGNKLTHAPDSAYTIDADYSVNLGDAGSLTFNVNHNWKDDYFTSASNAEVTRQEATGLLGASTSWTSNDGSWTATLWGKNLTDETVIANRIVDPTKVTSEYYTAPRTYGVTVSKSF